MDKIRNPPKKKIKLEEIIHYGWEGLKDSKDRLAYLGPVSFGIYSLYLGYKTKDIGFTIAGTMMLGPSLILFILSKYAKRGNWQKNL